MASLAALCTSLSTSSLPLCTALWQGSESSTTTTQQMGCRRRWQNVVEAEAIHCQERL